MALLTLLTLTHVSWEGLIVQHGPWAQLMRHIWDDLFLIPYIYCDIFVHDFVCCLKNVFSTTWKTFVYQSRMPQVWAMLIMRTENNLHDDWVIQGVAVAQRVEQVDYWSEGCWFKSQLRAGLSCMCPWARYWTPHCSLVRALRWAGDLPREYPALALRQGWNWLQQQHPVTPWKGISGYG